MMTISQTPRLHYHLNVRSHLEESLLSQRAFSRHAPSLLRERPVTAPVHPKETAEHPSIKMLPPYQVRREDHSAKVNAVQTK